jgi:hypothetical protein
LFRDPKRHEIQSPLILIARDAVVSRFLEKMGLFAGKELPMFQIALNSREAGQRLPASSCYHGDRLLRWCESMGQSISRHVISNLLRSHRPSRYGREWPTTTGTFAIESIDEPSECRRLRQSHNGLECERIPVSVMVVCDASDRMSKDFNR